MRRRLLVRGSLAVAALVIAALAAPGTAVERTQDPALLRTQREVWEAWSAGDTARLRTLTPGLIAIGPSGTAFDDQDAALQASSRSTPAAVVCSS